MVYRNIYLLSVQLTLSLYSEEWNTAHAGISVE